MADKWVMGWNHMKQMGINHAALSPPALMKRDANAADSARLLHPAPAEEIFKDPLWLISPPSLSFFFFFFYSPLLLWSLHWCCKQETGASDVLLVACERTSCAALPWEVCFTRAGGFVAFIAPCYAVRKLCKRDSGRMFKSLSD